MQNVQSNGLTAGLMILAFADLEQRREARAALSLSLATLIKIFPVVGAAFAIFRPYRIPRFALWSILLGVGLAVSPLLVLSPSQLADQYRWWADIQRTDAPARGYSVMEHLHLWLRVDWPNWAVQLAGTGVLLAPLLRLSHWGLPRFRLLFLSSVLMFCVLFNHKSESPTFVIALAGVAIWFAVSPRNRMTWTVLAIVFVGTVLSASDAMPEVLQQRYFEPYSLKVLPVLLVWILTQVELWRRREPTPPPAPELSPAQPAT
jgi:hypothetical protein